MYCTACKRKLKPGLVSALKGPGSLALIIAATVQELQAVKGKVEQLTAERDKALSDSVVVQQQRNCHADHAQLLVKENKRLTMQLQQVRLQQSQASSSFAQSGMEQPTQQENQTSKAGKRLAPSCTAPSNKQSLASHGAVTVKSDKKQFAGYDVKNVLHKNPFDLSKGCAQQSSKSSQAILKKAQEVRAAAHKLEQLS